MIMFLLTLLLKIIPLLFASSMVKLNFSIDFLMILLLILKELLEPLPLSARGSLRNFPNNTATNNPVNDIDFVYFGNWCFSDIGKVYNICGLVREINL